MNSLKSLCSFTEGLVVSPYDLESEIEPLLRRQRPAVLCVGAIGVGMGGEDPDDPLHSDEYTTRVGIASTSVSFVAHVAARRRPDELDDLRAFRSSLT
jgi:hypothetical protein